MAQKEVAIKLTKTEEKHLAKLRRDIYMDRLEVLVEDAVDKYFKTNKKAMGAEVKATLDKEVRLKLQELSQHALKNTRIIFDY